MWGESAGSWLADAKEAATRAARQAEETVIAAREAAEKQAAELRENAQAAALKASEQAKELREQANKIDLAQLQDAILFPEEEDTPSWETPARPKPKGPPATTGGRGKAAAAPAGAGAGPSAAMTTPRGVPASTAPKRGSLLDMGFPSFPPTGEAPTPISSIGAMLAPTPLKGAGGEGAPASQPRATAAKPPSANAEKLKAAEKRLEVLEAEALALRSAVMRCLPGDTIGLESHSSDELCLQLERAFDAAAAARKDDAAVDDGMEADFLQAKVRGEDGPCSLSASHAALSLR